MLNGLPSNPSRRTLARLIAGTAALTAGAGAARAAACPPGDVLTSPRRIEDKDDVGVKRETLAEIPIKGWRGMGDFRLRMRKLTVAEGGQIPTHYHDDRPSIVWVEAGEAEEHSTLCRTPVRYKAGEWSPEFGPGTGHWWRNVGRGELVFLSADIILPEWSELEMMD
jgi:quercetin dioxygenase-like cupin family protein